MSYVDDLVGAYAEFIELPWPADVAHAQRVLMAIYPPEQERRIRLHVPDFQVATEQAGRSWGQIDITTEFESWLGSHDYREQYFEQPRLLQPALGEFFDVLVGSVRSQLQHHGHDTVVGLIGAGSLFGLGDRVKVSALLNGVSLSISGRMLVFFPGQHQGNSYRLLDARDGWNYLATPILP